MPVKGLLALEVEILWFNLYPTRPEIWFIGGIDTEYKILDNIADQLGNNTSARGAVNTLTEKAACASCLNVAEQFKAKYPNITVNILDNQGVMLRPPRKTP
ncbi:TPA: deaminase domain-containing protein [Pseudomonas aeruginosa]